MDQHETSTPRRGRGRGLRGPGESRVGALHPNFATQQQAWSPSAIGMTPASSTPPTPTGGSPANTSDPQIWQCIQKLSFIAEEISRREERPQQWKPSAAMTPSRAKSAMTPTEFRVWRRSVTDFNKTCKWPKDQEAIAVRLLCDENIQKAIDSRVGQGQWEQFSIDEAMSVIQSIVTGPKCEVGAWSEFFKYAQEKGDNIVIS